MTSAGVDHGRSAAATVPEPPTVPGVRGGDVQVVLLMAGLGTRFASAGYDRSKPLIDVDGTPMFTRALCSLQGVDLGSIRAVVRQQQVDEEDILVLLHDAAPQVLPVVIPAMTRGAAESALAATVGLQGSAPLIVLDCDLEFRSEAYARAVARGADGDFDALLLTFRASSPRYSFARSDSSGRVDLVAEKRVISGDAVAGAYYFSRAVEFVESATRVIDRGTREGVPELYMSEVVQDFLDRGLVVRRVSADSYSSFGTPEELDDYLLVHGA